MNEISRLYYNYERHFLQEKISNRKLTWWDELVYDRSEFLSELEKLFVSNGVDFYCFFKKEVENIINYNEEKRTLDINIPYNSDITIRLRMLLDMVNPYIDSCLSDDIERLADFILEKKILLMYFVIELIMEIDTPNFKDKILTYYNSIPKDFRDNTLKLFVKTYLNYPANSNTLLD